MSKKIFQASAIVLTAAMLSGCFVQLFGATGGVIKTQSGGADCQSGAGTDCAQFAVVDGTFNETWTAVANSGYEFLHWKKGKDTLFWCTTSSSVNLNSAAWPGTSVENILNSSLVGYLRPVFRSTGARFHYSTDFECNDVEAADLGDGWTSYVNVFEADGTTYVGGYSVPAAPNGPQISALVSKQGGFDQAFRQLSVFSNYDSAYNNVFQHAQGQQLEVNVYQEYTISSASAGNYTFSFDAKLPPEGAVVTPSVANAFIKVLDPNDQYSTFAIATVDTATAGNEWGFFETSIQLTSAMSGMVLQFGFSNTSTNYDGSAVLYDNLLFAPSGTPR